MVELEKLNKLALRGRELIIDMAATPRGCHLGGSLSVIDLLIGSYGVFGNDPQHKIVLSKGHAAAALYATLYLFGEIEENPAPLYGMADQPYTGHPGSKVPGVTFPTGSLGHGIPHALGWAFAKKISGAKGFGVAIAGDGELQEGLCWEALQIAQAQKISNFILMVDCNGGQNDGLVEDISPLPNLENRLSSFGFKVFECNGHDIPSLVEILQGIQNHSHQKPTAILAQTTKAKGIPEIEGNPASHYAVIKLAKAIQWKRSLLQGV